MDLETAVAIANRLSGLLSQATLARVQAEVRADQLQARVVELEAQLATATPAPEGGRA
jgi:BMFP domain-containing protein YqiC